MPPAATPQRLYALGPAGTYSDVAARKLRAHLKLPDVPIVYTRTLPEVFDRAEADAEAWGVAPIENSDAGTVLQAQDRLVRHTLTAVWEVSLPIRFSALSRVPAGEARTLFVHPVAFEQCSVFVAARLPHAQVTFVDSNAAAGVRYLEAAHGDPVAAIVPADFALAHPRHLLQADVQNFANNTTRFLALRRRVEPERFDFTRRKTALFIEPKEDRPGLLYSLLSVFNRYSLNLCRLESRPDRVAPWQYVFFIDITNGPGSAQCIEDLKATGHRITVLGSFDGVE
jgi:prephenate dehydratase